MRSAGVPIAKKARTRHAPAAAKPAGAPSNEARGDGSARKPAAAAGRKAAPDPAPPSYHHGDLRNALVREGRRSLEELGVAELSLRAVARRTGVSEAAPSRHFDGKEGLLAAIASVGFRELAAQREEIAARPLGALAKARLMLLSYVRFAQRNKGVFNLMVGPRIIEPQRHEELLAVSSRSFDIFANALVELARETGWPPRSRELVAHAAWAVEHGLATLILADRAPRPDRDVDLEAMIGFSIDLLLSGVGAGPAACARVAADGAAAPATPAPRRADGA